MKQVFFNIFNDIIDTQDKVVIFYWFGTNKMIMRAGIIYGHDYSTHEKMMADIKRVRNDIRMEINNYPTGAGW